MIVRRCLTRGLVTMNRVQVDWIDHVARIDRPFLFAKSEPAYSPSDARFSADRLHRQPVRRGNWKVHTEQVLVAFLGSLGWTVSVAWTT